MQRPGGLHMKDAAPDPADEKQQTHRLVLRLDSSS